MKSIKKTMCLLMALVMLVSAWTTAFADIKIFSNGNDVTSSKVFNNGVFSAVSEGSGLFAIALYTEDELQKISFAQTEEDLEEYRVNMVINNAQNYTMKVFRFDENGNPIFNDLSDIVIISGTANGDEVTATETEDGIQVTGLNNITVTYETADGTAETTAKVDDGSTVNITVNDDENTVKTDWQCKHPDENHDGICDTCSEDFTKSCLCSCHSNAFMQFLHKILCFLYRIFGMEQYRYCGCGKAHW